MTQKFVTYLNIAFPFIFTQIKKNQTKQVTRGGNNNLGGGGGGNDGPEGGGLLFLASSSGSVRFSRPECVPF